MDENKTENSSGPFAYFMVRLRVQASGETSNLTGIVERLGTSRKRPFANSLELLDLLVDWSRLTSKMPRGFRAGNAAAPQEESSRHSGLEESAD